MINFGIVLTCLTLCLAIMEFMNYLGYLIFLTEILLS